MKTWEWMESSDSTITISCEKVFCMLMTTIPEDKSRLKHVRSPVFLLLGLLYVCN